MSPSRKCRGSFPLREDSLITFVSLGAKKAGRYLYDIEIVSPDSQVTRIIEGQVEITPGVTRA